MTVGKKSLYRPAEALESGHMEPAQYRQHVDGCNSGRLLTRPDLKRSGRRRAQRLREPDRPDGQDYTLSKTSDPAVALRELQVILKDPVKTAAFMADGRRPVGTNKTQYGLALRAATGEPMLTANHRQVKGALESNASLPTITAGGYDSTVVVKPTTAAAAKAGRSSSFWGERAWKVMVPKYGRGFFIRYDTGGDSRVYASRSDLVAAIRRSGFQVIKR